MTPLLFVKISAIITKLPAEAVWSVMLTQDNAPGNPVAFNVWVKSPVERRDIRNALGLGEPDWEGYGAEEHTEYDPAIILSIIEEELP